MKYCPIDDFISKVLENFKLISFSWRVIFDILSRVNKDVYLFAQKQFYISSQNSYKRF